MSNFGELLRQHRLTAELTQEALAERAGLSVNGIQKLESGGSRPQRETVRRLVHALELEPADLAVFRAAAQPTPRAGTDSTANGVAGRHLPATLTSFVGRERDKEEIARLLTTTRLLTLTGVGGSGKTRLALEVARLVGSRYADGVRLAELAALKDATLVPRVVASALEVRESPTQDLIASLKAALKSRCLLLLLDNCEHVLDACAQLASALLTACPGLHVMATSRQPLGVPGEAKWRVPSLPVPPLVPPPNAETLQGYAAAQLFVARAQADSPEFAVTDRNASTIAHVCDRLEGIPLAIELAAALVGALSVDDIAARLNQRLRLLTRGSRVALPRQRTLRATIDWSYELLSLGERDLFMRLAVFGGRWLLEDAEQVCAPLRRTAPADSGEHVLELLLLLVDKSLVVGEEGPDRPAAYRLLDTLRQYGGERLLASGESAAVHRQHARYYLLLAEQAEPQLNGPSQARWIDRLAFAEGELWAAVEWLASHHEVDRALRLAAVLGRFWQLRGHLHERRRRLAYVLALPGAEAPTLARARALEAAGALAMYQGDVPATRSLLKESLALYRQHGDQAGVAWVLLHLGWMAHDHHRHKAARRLLQKALALFMRIDDRRGIARAKNALGMVATIEGELDLAVRLHQESLALSREVGDRWAIAWALSNLGVDQVTLAKLGRASARSARALFDEGLAIWDELGERRHLAFTHMNIADWAILEGDLALAHARLEHSLALFGDLEDASGMFFAVSIGASLLWAYECHEQALLLLGATYGRTKIVHHRVYPLKEAVAELCLAEARTLLATERYDAAWSAGCAMAMPEALAYLHGELASFRSP